MPSLDCIIAGVLTLMGLIGGALDAHGEAVTAIATIFIGIFTWTLWRATKRSGEHFQVSERAYMQMSHKGGITFPDGERVRLTLQIRNWGKTPGTVVDHNVGPFLVMAKDADLPAQVDYSRLQKTASPETFLVPSGRYNWSIGFEFEDQGIVQAIIDGHITLFMLGYVDYRDQFDCRWRAGYARKYTPDHPEGNNLSYVTARGFNSDRQRLSGEGPDWRP